MLSQELRTLGQTNIRISPVAMGCWPIAGVTSLDVNDRDSLATLEAAVEAGINFFDTAYIYGYAGESEKLIGRALGQRRDEIVIATKGGIHWDENKKQRHDARPATLRRECEESLRRLNTDRVELLYLHSPDPSTPLAESAGELRRLMEEGKALSIGVSNFTVQQHQEFHAVCAIAASQPPYNMLRRDIEGDLVPWCREQNISLLVYWPLMKGLLAGKLSRDHVFSLKDGRAKYPMFHGEEWQKNQDMIDELRKVAEQTGRTVAQVVINWTIQQPGITAALCGAKRPEQIRETAGALGWQLSTEQLATIEAALVRRGEPVWKAAV